MDRQRCTSYPRLVNVVPTPIFKGFETHDLSYSYDTCECPIRPPIISVSVDSACLQIRVAWVPELSACGVLNTDRFKPSVIAMFVADMALLVIMLVGLLRLRLHIFGLGELLWKQVGHATSRPLQSLMRFPCERV